MRRARRSPHARARAFAAAGLAACSALAGGAALSAGAALAACGGDPPLDVLYVPPTDAAPEGGGLGPGPEGGVDPELGGPCADDAQCDDGVACTFDRCDLTVGRCRHVTDDATCQDALHCNGRETCVRGVGCRPGPPVTCADDTACTVDRCVEATRSCAREPRDLDGDGDPDLRCGQGRDCDDTDPLVSSTRREVCGNGRDDDCDGQVDEADCAAPANDTCGAPLRVSAPGTFLLDASGARRDHPGSCSVDGAQTARDLVVAVDVPPGDARDVEVWATARGTNDEASVSLRTSCPDPASELACAALPGARSARAVARSAPGGSTVFAVVTTIRDAPVDVKVDLRSASVRPTNESCAAPEPVATDVPFVARLVDPARDLPSACAGDGPGAPAGTGELTYAFTLDAPRDVTLAATTRAGLGSPRLSLRDAGCTGERACRSGRSSLFARLGAGTHVLAVSGTETLDADVLVRTAPPTPAPPEATCATAPPLAAAGPTRVELGAVESATERPCLPGAPSAAFAFTLDRPSDVVALARLAVGDEGFVSIEGAACAAAEQRACEKGSTPLRAAARNLPAGTYRLVVGSRLGLSAAVEVLARPAAAPVTVVGGDACATAVVVPPGGATFVGDTTTAIDDGVVVCEAQGARPAPDRFFRLDLQGPERVVLDTAGSTLRTALAVRAGPACPGADVPGACFLGYGASRSFLDLDLPAGTVYVQVDGTNGEAGPFVLDVRRAPRP